jgi:hypothetical protein
MQLDLFSTLPASPPALAAKPSEDDTVKAGRVLIEARTIQTEQAA